MDCTQVPLCHDFVQSVTTAHKFHCAIRLNTLFVIYQVLYQSLPLMLESCIEESVSKTRGARPIVIGDAVEFLQALLDLVTDQHLHLEVSLPKISRLCQLLLIGVSSWD